jgi:thiol-disulfide isomerase/thioredoxin
MSDQKVSQYSRKRYLGYSVILILTVIACQLPNKIVESLSLSKGEPTSAEKSLPTARSLKDTVTLSFTPFQGQYPEQPILETPALPDLTSEPFHTPANEEYPVSSEPPVASSSFQSVTTPYPQQGLDAYPVGTVVSQNEALLTSTQGTAYPGAVFSQTPTSSTETYPGQETLKNLASATIGTKPVSYPGPTLLFTLSPPTFLPAGPPIITLTATPNKVIIPPSITPTATRTPFLTPTPTLTFTPTPTRTPLPAPPWLNVRIRATDPKTVELASGKPQLIQFFAYWSGPSLAMAPIIAGLENEYSSRVGFVYIDIDNPASEPLQEILGFKREPHFFLLNGEGKLMSEWIGYATLEELRSKIEAVIP